MPCVLKLLMGAVLVATLSACGTTPTAPSSDRDVHAIGERVRDVTVEVTTEENAGAALRQSARRDVLFDAQGVTTTPAADPVAAILVHERQAIPNDSQRNAKKNVQKDARQDRSIYRQRGSL